MMDKIKVASKYLCFVINSEVTHDEADMCTLAFKYLHPLIAAAM